MNSIRKKFTLWIIVSDNSKPDVSISLKDNTIKTKKSILDSND